MKTVRRKPRDLLLVRIGATLLVLGIVGVLWRSEPWQLTLSAFIGIAGCALLIAGGSFTRKINLYRGKPKHHDISQVVLRPCDNCRMPVEVADATRQTPVLCSSCGRLLRGRLISRNAPTRISSTSGRTLGDLLTAVVFNPLVGILPIAALAVGIWQGHTARAVALGVICLGMAGVERYIRGTLPSLPRRRSKAKS